MPLDKFACTALIKKYGELREFQRVEALLDSLLQARRSNTPNALHYAAHQTL